MAGVVVFAIKQKKRKLHHDLRVNHVAFSLHFRAASQSDSPRVHPKYSDRCDGEAGGHGISCNAWTSPMISLCGIFLLQSV